jgi:hypothetical protein
MEEIEKEIVHDNERRKTYTPEEIELLKTQILDSIYADIGKSIVKKILWIGGAVVLAAFAWLAGKGHINIGG